MWKVNCESRIYAVSGLRGMSLIPAFPPPYSPTLNISIFCFILPGFLFVKINRYMFLNSSSFLHKGYIFFACSLHHLTLFPGSHFISVLRAPPHSFFQLYSTPLSMSYSLFNQYPIFGHLSSFQYF